VEEFVSAALLQARWSSTNKKTKKDSYRWGFPQFNAALHEPREGNRSALGYAARPFNMNRKRHKKTIEVMLKSLGIEPHHKSKSDQV
jgi:hypothetical protein